MTRVCKHHGEQDISKYRPRITPKGTLSHVCKLCSKIRKRSPRYRAGNIARLKTWRKNNKEYIRTQSSKHKQENIERYRILAIPASHKVRARYRLKVLRAYTDGDEIVCSCCGEFNIEFLALDHIDGGGAKQRKEISRNSNRLNIWIIKNNFPSGYRILCHNCNHTASTHGICVHDPRWEDRLKIKKQL